MSVLKGCIVKSPLTDLMSKLLAQIQTSKEKKTHFLGKPPHKKNFIIVQLSGFRSHENICAALFVYKQFNQDRTIYTKVIVTTDTHTDTYTRIVFLASRGVKTKAITVPGLSPNLISSST